jgi:PAS domain S-box-containing protein
MSQLDGLVELAPDPLLVADDAGTVVRANDEAAALFASDAETLTGRSLDDLLDVPESDRGPTALAEPTPASSGLGCQLVRQTGETAPVDLRVSRASIDGEEYLVTSLSAADRAERLADLRDSEERYRRLLEHSPAPIVIYDADGRIVYANRAAATLHEVAEPDDLVGKQALEFIHPDERSVSQDGIDKVIEERVAVENVERRLVTAEGSTRHVVLSGSPTTFEGEPAGQVVHSDVTELKERERELERQNERLDRFASIVSHDLRNPLTILRSSLELIDAEDEHVERGKRAVDRMDELVDGLLTIARQGQPPDETEPVDLAAVTRAAWQQVETEEATLEVVAEGTVEAAGSRLQELFENLLHNAVNHGGGDVTVTVGVQEQGFFVADDGPGIPPEDRETVFEGGYSTVEGNTGLGLAIVNEIADAHGWDVTLGESDEGGARFEFRTG